MSQSAQENFTAYPVGAHVKLGHERMVQEHDVVTAHTEQGIVVSTADGRERTFEAQEDADDYGQCESCGSINAWRKMYGTQCFTCSQED